MVGEGVDTVVSSNHLVHFRVMPVFVKAVDQNSIVNGPASTSDRPFHTWTSERTGAIQASVEQPAWVKLFMDSFH